MMEGDKPLFSIVTPTFNRETFLSEMIESVIAQTFRRYEHIIVDDGSTDDTELLIQQFVSKDNRIRYIKQENKGRSVARNVGVEAAKGEFICFLDSDDKWLPSHLAVINTVTAMKTTPALFHTGLIWFHNDGKPNHYVQYASRNTFSSNVEYVISNQFAPDCVCVHKSIFLKHSFSPELFINEDVELWARIASEFPIISIEAHTAMLRVHEGNTDKIFGDTVTPRKDAFNVMLKNSFVRKQLSAEFIKSRQRGLDELWVRHLDNTGQHFKLVTAIVSFLLKYPNNPRNSAKVVTLLYNLPGGSLLKSLVAIIKRKNG
jgi:glycosyltransferase involved in cell wall biosynthesis